MLINKELLYCWFYSKKNWSKRNEQVVKPLFSCFFLVDSSCWPSTLLNLSESTLKGPWINERRNTLIKDLRSKLTWLKHIKHSQFHSTHTITWKKCYGRLKFRVEYQTLKLLLEYSRTNLFFSTRITLDCMSNLIQSLYNFFIDWFRPN